MVDEYQDTNRPQYLLIRRLAAVHRNLAVVGDPDQSIYKWRGADLRNILDFEHDFPEARTVKLEQNYRSTQVILDAATAVIQQNRNRKDKRLWTERRGGARIVYYRGNDELEEADFITRSIKQARVRRTSTRPSAVLYRTNAQSRAIEDALMREQHPLQDHRRRPVLRAQRDQGRARLPKLIINPHDDVSLRRVINVPARGVGKGVMDSLQAIDPDAVHADAPPLLAAGLQEIASARSLWAQARLRRRRGEAAAAGGRVAARVQGSHRPAWPTWRAQDSVSIAIGKMLDQSGYLADLCATRTARRPTSGIENLMELVSAARDYEVREPEASLGGFVDRLSLLSEADEESGRANAKVWMMTMHAAKGLEFPMVVIAGLEEGLFPHSRSSEDEEETRRGAPPVLRRHDARADTAGPDQRGAAAGVRRVSVHRTLAVPRRDPGGAGRADRPAAAPQFGGSSCTATTSSGRTPTARKGRGRARPGDETGVFVRERGSVGRWTSALACASGTRSSASGTSSPSKQHNDDLKITVRFNTVGVEKAAREIREARAGVAPRSARALALAGARPYSAGGSSVRIIRRLGRPVDGLIGVVFFFRQLRQRDDLHRPLPSRSGGRPASRGRSRGCHLPACAGSCPAG